MPPLPCVVKGAKQCTARSKRTGLPCNNPAAHGCRTCRVHGARRQETIKKGKDHPQFTFGNETRERRVIRADKLREMKKYAGILKKIDRLKKI
jgi:hypothetical protein